MTAACAAGCGHGENKITSVETPGYLPDRLQCVALGAYRTMCTPERERERRQERANRIGAHKRAGRIARPIKSHAAFLPSRASTDEMEKRERSIAPSLFPGGLQHCRTWRAQAQGIHALILSRLSSSCLVGRPAERQSPFHFFIHLIRARPLSPIPGWSGQDPWLQPSCSVRVPCPQLPHPSSPRAPLSRVGPAGDLSAWGPGTWDLEPSGNPRGSGSLR